MSDMTRDEWMERWLLHAERNLNLKKPKKGGKQYNENVLQDLLNWAWQGGYGECKHRVITNLEKKP